MLVPVGSGQVRFAVPGLVSDARGIVTGRELLVRFATWDRLVWFLRLLSGEQVPDEIWLGLRIRRARASSGLRELVAMLPNPSSHSADLIARAARTAGGQCFTGTAKHYVPWRDARASLGYDARALSTEKGDIVLYTPEGSAGYLLEGEMSLERVLLGLELSRRRGTLESSLPSGRGAALFVQARRGVGPHLARYLFEAGQAASACLLEPERADAFGNPAGSWLFRVEDVPRRMVGLLGRTPGLSLYVPVLDNVLVAAGWSHPLHLEACRALFKPDRLVVFSPPPAGATVLGSRLPLLPLEDLLPLRAPMPADAAPPVLTASPPKVLEIPVRLEPTAMPAARAVAAWIPWRQAHWLRRLCYALPPAALRGHRIALLESAIFVLASEQLSGLPFGQLLDRVGPGVLAPVGFRLAPAIDARRLIESLAIPEGTLLVFPAAGARPVRVAASELEPLERRILAQAGLDPAPPALLRRDQPTEERGPPDVVHEPLGPWPLWGVGW